MIRQVEYPMKLLIKHVERSEVLECACYYDERKWTMDKVNRMNSNIAYNFRFIPKRYKKEGLRP